MICARENRAQGIYQIGILPALNINIGLPGDYGLNFKSESRQAFVTGEFSAGSEKDYEYVLSDFSLIASKKVGLANKIAGGYLIRIRDNRIIHRTIQQYTLIRRFGTFRLAHRFAADQSFASDEDVELRLRYRITSEFPLNGESVDAREFYFKINNEYLNAFQGNTYDLEMRISPLFGYQFSDNNKLEYGLDYRLGSFLNNSSKNNLWVSISWYVKI